MDKEQQQYRTAFAISAAISLVLVTAVFALVDLLS